MSNAGKILGIDPQFGLAGGEVSIECANLDTSNPTLCAVWFGEERAPIVALSPNRVLAVVPESRVSGSVEVRLECAGLKSEPATMTLGRRLTEDLHPVANPALVLNDGALFLTQSGSLGQPMPVTLVRIDVTGSWHDFPVTIPHRTG